VKRKITEIHESRLGCLEIRSKTHRTLHILIILEILESLKAVLKSLKSLITDLKSGTSPKRIIGPSATKVKSSPIRGDILANSRILSNITHVVTTWAGCARHYACLSNCQCLRYSLSAIFHSCVCAISCHVSACLLRVKGHRSKSCPWHGIVLTAANACAEEYWFLVHDHD